MKELKLSMIAFLSMAILFSCSNDSDEIIEDQKLVSRDLVLQESSDVELLEDIIRTSREENEERIQEVIHNYNYYGEEFSVTYVFDNESDEMLNVSGDVERAEELFGNEETSPQGFLFDDIQEESNRINIRLFNLAEEVNEYIDLSLEQRAGNENRTFGCINDGISQTRGASFYFFKHSNYNVEMPGMRRIQMIRYRDSNLGVDNDQLSSLIVLKGSSYRNTLVCLYEHSCFRGRVKYFYSNKSFFISNLKRYRLSSWWPFQNSNWNDRTSSTLGAAWN